MSALREKLREKEQVNTKQTGKQIWKPEEGDILEGKVLTITNTITQYGDADICDIEDETGDVYTVFMNKVLVDLFEKEGIEEGDTVAIKFCGLKKSQKGKKTYKNYIIVKG